MHVKKYTAKLPLDGFISDMPNDIYHSTHGFISKSGLDLINKSPAHYMYGAQREPSRSMHLGSAIHCAILEPDVFERDYLLLKDVKDRRSSAYKEALNIHKPENILTSTEANTVSGMYESAMSDKRIVNWLRDVNHTEISLFTKCPNTGVSMRCRYDAITNDGYAIDLKSTRDASPDEFAKSIYNFRYHVQAALYSDAYEFATGKKLKGFIFLVVESEMPHATMVYELDDISLDIGRREYQRNLKTYAECLQTNEWKGYETHGDNVDLIALPEWAITRHEAENDSDIITV